MKKNLPIFLLVLFTVFTVLSGNTTYQNLLLQHRFSINKETGKNNLSFYPELIQQANETTIQSVKNQNDEMIPGFSHPERKVNLNSIVTDEISSKETNAGDGISRCRSHNLFDDPVSGNNKKGDEMITNQVGWAGIVLVRLYFESTKFSGKKLAKYHSISVSQKTGG